MEKKKFKMEYMLKGGTENIINMCLEQKECRKLVYVSSTGAIPELPHGQKIKEVQEVNLDLLKGWYSKSKAIATNNVYTAIKARGLKACVVYPTGILGPNDPAISETTSTVIKIIKGEMPIGINGSFNLVDVRDLAAGCIAHPITANKRLILFKYFFIFIYYIKISLQRYGYNLYRNLMKYLHIGILCRK